MSLRLSYVVGLVWILSACAATDVPGNDLDGSVDDPDGSGFIDARLAPDADTTDARPGHGFGEMCTDQEDCDSEICVFAGSSGVCSRRCPPDCPDGYGCFE